MTTRAHAPNIRLTPVPEGSPSPATDPTTPAATKPPAPSATDPTAPSATKPTAPTAPDPTAPPAPGPTSSSATAEHTLPSPEAGRRSWSLLAVPPARTPGNLPPPSAGGITPGRLSATSAPEPDGGQAGDRFRSRIVELLDHYDGATEGDAKFNSFRSPESLRAARVAAGRLGRTFTTCIEFLGHVQSEAARTSNVRLLRSIDARMVDAKERSKLPEGAWHEPGGGERPQPGDVLIMVFDENVYNPDGSLKYGAGWFSHVAIVRSIEASGDGDLERWITVDGGQGSATVYDRDGNLVRQGREAIRRVDRPVDPSTGVVPGSPRRRIIGWVNMASMARERSG